MAHNGSSLSRRRVLATGGAGFAAAAMPGVAWSAGQAAGSAMTERAAAFVQLLDPGQGQAARFAFDSPVRLDWNFMGVSVKPGLPLERMNPVQKTAAMELIASGLSADGLRKAERVMVLQDVLREMGSGPADRNRERFSVAVFGEPTGTGTWGWRLEGHHLSLSYTLAGGEIVAVTPSSFSSNPNVVRSGSHSGTVALIGEDISARRLYADLGPAQRARALIREQAFGNVLTTAGRERRLEGQREGVAVADLHPAQADLLMRLVEVYAVDHLSPPLAAQQAARVRSGDRAATHFAWAGSDREGEMWYYRLHGDTFLIEFASLRGEPLHLHTIRHDLERNLGAHVEAS